MKNFSMLLIAGFLLIVSTEIAFAGPPEGFVNRNSTATYKGEILNVDYKTEKLVLKDTKGKIKVFHAYPKSLADLNVGDSIKVVYWPNTNHVAYAKK